MAKSEAVLVHLERHRQGSDKTLERFERIVRLAGEDSVAISLIEKLVESAERYFTTVTSMEARLKMARLRLEGEELRDLAETLDRNRRLAHNALIDNLTIANRYLLKEFGEEIPVGGIFSKNPEAIRDRAAVGDWAGELLYALYTQRKR
ncbi:MAG: DUF3232 domain-containing protein [Vulcanimicrobiota bacterium]